MMQNKSLKYLLQGTASALLLLLSGRADGQDSLWALNEGGQYNDNGYACRRLSESDWAAVGSTFSYGAGNYDIYLVKFDSTGGVLWEKTFGGAGADYGADLQITSDSGFILVGSTISWGSGKKDICLIKADRDGLEQWRKTYGGAADDEAASLQIMPDGGYLIGGTTASFGGGTDIYVIRTNPGGDTLWTRRYGGPAGETGSALCLTNDGGFMVTGSTGSFGVGYSSVYVVRGNVSGDTLWSATYGNERADLGYTIEPTNDNGFIIAGATVPTGKDYYDAYLVKVDSFGVLEWQNTFGRVYEDRAYSVTCAPDGGYLLAGTSESTRGKKIDIYLVKTDPVGDMEWDTTYGGLESDFCRMITADPENNLMLIGSSYSYTAGGSDLYVMKIKGTGMTPVDWDGDAPRPDMISLRQNYPNPFNAGTRIIFSLPTRSSYRLTIYNILGQCIRRWEQNEAWAREYTVDWDGTDDSGYPVASGIYLYKLSAGSCAMTRKMVLLK